MKIKTISNFQDQQNNNVYYSLLLQTKLESYRAIQFSGKELSQDQKTAVAKYNEVAQSLELARDFVKQLSQLSSNYEKEVKKQLRKVSFVFIIKIK